ncbi:hypothetical protein F4776DRAFT_660963 [Hypoxylon sp. NC0597]|nr:hypothetical protein F4776DRAFT_660963 [Hypoxylon sp. NC0597]
MSNTSRLEAIPEAEPREDVSRLLELPIEMVQCISGYLSEVDAVCLALTCKALLSLLGGRDRSNLQLELPAKETLLCRLEADIVGVLYCHFCRKLIRFDNDARLDTRGLKRIKLSKSHPLECTLSSTVSFLGASFELPYYVARLVTNYQLFGPKHGIPLSYLSYQYQHPYPDNISSILSRPWGNAKVGRKEAVTAKLIENELFLSWTYELFHENADTVALLRYMATRPLFICQHKTIGTHSYNWRHGRDRVSILTEKPRWKWDGGYRKTDSCAFCMTDWEISIEWVNPQRGWVITVTTYHELGHCRSPSDQIWKSLVHPSIESEFRDAPGGAIKRRWLGEESISHYSPPTHEEWELQRSEEAFEPRDEPPHM